MEDYKEKYEQALDNFKKIKAANKDNNKLVDFIEYKYPELKESEDESIRKAIKEAICNYWNDDTQAKTDCLAWLEKQGDYNRLIEEMKERKKLLSKEKEKATSSNDKLSLGGRIAILEELLAFTNKNQGEKKSADISAIKNKAHQIGWETSKHYDPNASKQEWCEMAAMDMACWLEKQVEEKSKISAWKHWKDGIAGNGDGKQVFLIKNGTNYSISSCLGCECDYIELSELDNILLQGKQDEQKPTDETEPKFKVGDKIRRKTPSYYDKDMQVARIEKDYYICNHIGKFSSEVLPFSNQSSYELIDKVESKFKVGDWIINSEGMLRHILSVDKTGYQTDYGWLTHDIYDNTYHLWTIQDAKDGDVLYECNEKKPFIFKELKTKHIGDIASYCDIFNGIFNPNEDNWTTLDIVPATKEQRDFLFQKMKEAGYEWDAEKKELKKIEQKPTDKVGPKFKVGDIIKYVGEREEFSKEKHTIKKILDDCYLTIDDMYIPFKFEEYYIPINQNQPWSEEDEETIDRIYNFIWKNRRDDTSEIYQQEKDAAWLKSLKERMKGE